MSNPPRSLKLLFAKFVFCNIRYIFICLSVLLVLNLIRVVHIDRAATDRNAPTAKALQCYRLPQMDKDVLNVHEYKVLPNSIFFLETSCRHGASVVISKREACAFESAAKVHPDSEVLVLFPSPMSLKNPSVLVSELLNYPNIKLMHIDVEKYFLGTPLESFYKKNRIDESRFPLSHMSDVLRYLTLWKYGGTYLDADFIIMRPINKIKNFAGAQSPISLNGAAMNFNMNSTGRLILDRLMSEVRDHFRGHKWAANGPTLLSRVLRAFCKEDDILKMTRKKCNGFTVFPPPVFYPVPYENWRTYFKENVSRSVINTLGRSFGIHVWNHLSSETPVKVGSTAPYSIFASKFCPRIYSVVGEYI